jgi:hypothetical protein
VLPKGNILKVIIYLFIYLLHVTWLIISYSTKYYIQKGSKR